MRTLLIPELFEEEEKRAKSNHRPRTATATASKKPKIEAGICYVISILSVFIIYFSVGIFKIIIRIRFQKGPDSFFFKLSLSSCHLRCKLNIPIVLRISI